MKKLILLLVALSLAMAVPALAGERGPLNTQYTNYTFIGECITWNLHADFQVRECLDPEAMAKAIVAKTDYNGDNTFIFSNLDSKDQITNSFGGFSGIAQVNQSSGSINNQGNVVAAAVTTNGSAAADAEAMLEQDNPNCYYHHDDNDRNVTKFNDTIDGSFGGFTGLAQVNQSAGFNNNQNNAVALSADTKGGIVALANASLAQNNCGNSISLCNVTSANTISGSFSGFTGLAQVNQSSGSLNNQANVVAIATGVVK
jgi:hypothetical protein